MSKELEFEQRLQKFAASVIALCREIKINPYNRAIIDQVIRSAASIGANYTEANCASLKRDFVAKVSISRKESQETKFWLKLLLDTEPEFKNSIELLWQECHEVSLIFHKIIYTIKQNKK